MIKLSWQERKLRPDGASISTSLTERETTTIQSFAWGGDVLEIGAGYGYSAIAMAMAANSVYSVDPHNLIPRSGDIMKDNIESYGVSEKITMDYRMSQSALPLLYYKGRRFQVIFIDGDHRLRPVIHDLVWAQLLVDAPGAIIIHDYQEVACPEVTDAVDLIFPLGPTFLVDTLFIYERTISSTEAAQTSAVGCVTETQGSNR